MTAAEHRHVQWLTCPTCGDDCDALPGCVAYLGASPTWWEGDSATCACGARVEVRLGGDDPDDPCAELVDLDEEEAP